MISWRKQTYIPHVVVLFPISLAQSIREKLRRASTKEEVRAATNMARALGLTYEAGLGDRKLKTLAWVLMRPMLLLSLFRIPTGELLLEAVMYRQHYLGVLVSSESNWWDLFLVSLESVGLRSSSGYIWENGRVVEVHHGYRVVAGSIPPQCTLQRCLLRYWGNDLILHSFMGFPHCCEP